MKNIYSRYDYLKLNNNLRKLHNINSEIHWMEFTYDTSTIELILGSVTCFIVGLFIVTNNIVANDSSPTNIFEVAPFLCLAPALLFGFTYYCLSGCGDASGIVGTILNDKIQQNPVCKNFDDIDKMAERLRTFTDAVALSNYCQNAENKGYTVKLNVTDYDNLSTVSVSCFKEAENSSFRKSQKFQIQNDIIDRLFAENDKSDTLILDFSFIDDEINKWNREYEAFERKLPFVSGLNKSLTKRYLEAVNGNKLDFSV